AVSGLSAIVFGLSVSSCGGVRPRPSCRAEPCGVHRVLRHARPPLQHFIALTANRRPVRHATARAPTGAPRAGNSDGGRALTQAADICVCNYYGGQADACPAADALRPEEGPCP